MGRARRVRRRRAQGIPLPRNDVCNATAKVVVSCYLHTNGRAPPEMGNRTAIARKAPATRAYSPATARIFSLMCSA
ncbi:hypothetical protein PSAB6_620016 [Paraburkholderia sabiae]|nr:hypothetical protein PSAB6_620016 [Paraburkholderia sabiae]